MFKHATVKKTKSNKYFVSLTLEAQEDVKELQEVYEKKIVAYDMSAKNFLVNNLVKLENPRFYRVEQKKIKKLNKELSRKKQGSKNREKAHLERVWTCMECGTTHERDENASVNLKNEGIRILKEEKHLTIIHDNKPTGGTPGSHAFGDDVRPQEIL